MLPILLGEGERVDEFDIPFPEEYEQTPNIVTFITGFKINPDSGSHCLHVGPWLFRFLDHAQGREHGPLHAVGGDERQFQDPLREGGYPGVHQLRHDRGP